MHGEPESRSYAPPPARADATFAKITWRLIPFLGVLWILAWIDRVNIGFAKLQMLDDLKFSQTVYGFGAGVLFVGYFLFEVPSNLLLARIGARKTIARITIGWGVICILQMFVRTPLQFYVVRFLLGACEAGFYPGIIFYLSAWYPAPRRARAFGLFMSASAIAGVLGGPFAGSVMAGLGGVAGWAGWQWLFLLEGLPSVVAGFVTLAYLPDRPEEARWLDSDDRRAIAAELANDRQDAGPREHHAMSVFANPRVWLLIAIFFCLLWANSTLTFWAPSIIAEAGFGASAVGWIAGGAYLVGAAGMIFNGFDSDRRREVRGHFAFAAALGAVGLALTRNARECWTLGGRLRPRARHHRHDERHSGLLAIAEPLPRRRRCGSGGGDDQFGRQSGRRRRSLVAGRRQGCDGPSVGGAGRGGARRGVGCGARSGGAVASRNSSRTPSGVGALRDFS